MDQANLIHMGGRVYDPRIARFLSADPLVQAPELSQSFNRYSYVMNNPMNYVDPSGYSWLSDNWRTIASIAISFYMPGILTGAFETMSAVTAKVLTGMTAGAVQTGSLKGALQGGFSAAMFAGIGGHFDSVAEANMAHGPVKGAVAGTGLTGAQFGAKIAAHAAAGGVMGVLQGGKFGHGFASAGLGEALSPVTMRVGGSPGRTFVIGVVVGGTSSVIAGGKFGNGATTAAFQWAFNHGASKAGDSHELSLTKVEEALIKLHAKGIETTSRAKSESYFTIKIDGSVSEVTTTGCTLNRCRFDDLSGVRVVVHGHPPTREGHLHREWPGPNDHLLLTKHGVINVFKTPSGAIRAIELVSGSVRLRTLVGPSRSLTRHVESTWTPGMGSDEIAKAARGYKD